MKELERVIENRQIEKFRKIVTQEGFHANQQDEEGNTALHYATTTPSGICKSIPLDDIFVEMVSTLLNKGADISVRNKKGLTAGKVLVERFQDYKVESEYKAFYANLIINCSGTFKSIIALFNEGTLNMSDVDWVYKLNTQCAKQLLEWVKDFQKHGKDRAKNHNILDFYSGFVGKFHSALSDKILIDELYPNLERALLEFNDSSKLNILLRAFFTGHSLRNSIDSLMSANESKLKPLTPESIKIFHKITEEAKIWEKVLFSAKAELEPLSEDEVKSLETLNHEVLKASNSPSHALKLACEHTKENMGKQEKPDVVREILSKKDDTLSHAEKLAKAAEEKTNSPHFSQS